MSRESESTTRNRRKLRDTVSRRGPKTDALRSVATKLQICHLLRAMTIANSKGPKDVLGFKYDQPTLTNKADSDRKSTSTRLFAAAVRLQI